MARLAIQINMAVIKLSEVLRYSFQKFVWRFLIAYYYKYVVHKK